MRKEITIISGFIGFAIGTCSMMFVNLDKQVIKIEVEKDIIPTRLIQENINTCEDIIEWMGQDVENYADSTVFDTYIYNLKDMIEDNRNVLYTVEDRVESNCENCDEID